MTAKQILDSFSETLMQDERIFSAQERALVRNLLQHAKTAAAGNLETHEAVRTVIASAIGETVAQRAFALLGGSIVERIVESSSFSVAETSGGRTEFIGAPTPLARQPEHPGVQAPAREPQPPAPLQPQHPGSPLGTPVPPSPQPQHPGSGVSTKVVSGSSTATAERPQALPANCVVLDEFLAPQELEELTRFTLEHEAEFQPSEIYSPRMEKGVIHDDYRRSLVLMDLGEKQEAMLSRIKSALPQVLERLGMEEFTIADVEAQITASNDGDFFHLHDDNGSQGVAARHLTFV